MVDWVFIGELVWRPCTAVVCYLVVAGDVCSSWWLSGLDIGGQVDGNCCSCCRVSDGYLGQDGVWLAELEILLGCKGISGKVVHAVGESRARRVWTE